MKSRKVVLSDMRQGLEVLRHKALGEYADCCGQRWYVCVEKFPDLLTFCHHHWLQHALALIVAGWAVDVDRTDELKLRD